MLEGYRVGTYLCEVDVARWAGFYRVIIAEHEVVCFKGTFCHSLAIVPNKSLSLSLSLLRETTRRSREETKEWVHCPTRSMMSAVEIEPRTPTVKFICDSFQPAHFREAQKKSRTGSSMSAGTHGKRRCLFPEGVGWKGVVVWGEV